MRILLTNDDGIQAPGILAAYGALCALGEVFVIAPERPRSAAGHAITLHKPLRITPTVLPDGGQGYATSGTPTDCVTLGTEIVMEGRCDLVVSGINSGANLGWDLTYSGTVAAAIEGAVLGIPSFAISLVLDVSEGQPLDFGPAAACAARIARLMQSDPLPPNTLLNINVPNVPAHQLRPATITHQGRREYVDRIVRREDPSGRPYYWLAGSLREDVPDPGSDVHAVLENRISVTPVHLDMTAYPLLERLREWRIEG
jgi:5'-nucleotidase